MTEHLSKAQHQLPRACLIWRVYVMEWKWGSPHTLVQQSRSHNRGIATWWYFYCSRSVHYQPKRWMLNIPRRCKDWGCMYSSQRCYGVSDCALLLISQLPWERNCITLACEIECNSEFAARCCNRKNLGRYRGLWFWVWTPSTPTRCAKSVKNTHRIEKLANDHLGISVWITEIHSSQNSDLLYFNSRVMRMGIW